MTSWDRAIAFVLQAEGGYVNDPSDPGGETNFGISRASYPSEDIKGLTIERARELYKRDYWDASGAEQLPEALAIAVFDCAVNQGTLIAIKLLQISLQVTEHVPQVVVDGIIGQKTVAAAHRAGDVGVWLFLLERAKRYMQTKKVEVYGANWGQRLVELGKELFVASDREAWPGR